MTFLSKLLLALLAQNFLATVETFDCDHQKLCGRNVTRFTCEQRQCCFDPSSLRLENCFGIRGKVSPYNQIQKGPIKTPIDPFELPPDDAVQLPPGLESLILQLGNLSKAEAIEAINKLESYLKEITIHEGSYTDWDYGIDGAFSAFIKVNSDSVFDPVVFSSGTEVQIDETSGKLGNGSMRNISRAILVEYPKLMTVFKQDQEKKDGCEATDTYLDDSPIISITAFDRNWNKLSVPVTYTVKGLNTSRPLKTNEMRADLSCKYLNESVKQWLSAGCTVAAVQNSLMTCSCNHTTKFSMLFVIYPMSLNISAYHFTNIQTLEYIMQSLSFTCLIATLGVLWLVQRRRSRSSSVSNMRAGERTAVHANFVAALAILHLVRLCSAFALEINVACAVIVVLSHYFMLASGMWMLIEGLLLYLNVILSSMRNTALGIHKYWAGWGIPAVIVLISAAIGFVRDSYIEREEIDMCRVDVNVNMSRIPNYYQTCWLSKSSSMIWAATGPLIVIFAINIFILAHTVIFVWRLNRKTDSMRPSDYSRDNKQYFWKTAKSILVLFPILGVPWLIGFMINIEHGLVNLIFQYLHVILNGLQGFFIFLLYCIVNKESRSIVLRVANNRWEQHKVSISASNTLGRSTSGGSRKERSMRGHRKSISSQMGVSEQNQAGTPVYTRRPSNVKSIGSAVSQYSIYTSSMNRKQSSGSGSTNVSGCAQRIHRINTAEIMRSKPGYYMKAGSSVSLPRLGKYESFKQVVRTGSVSSVNLIGRQSSISWTGRHQKSIEPSFICKVCKDLPCIHAASDVAGLTELQAEGTGDEPILLGYKTTSSLDSLTPESQQSMMVRWPRRMTAEEFKRFSAIPEEKRRSGINSFMAGDSSECLSNKFSALSTLKVDEEIEIKDSKVTVPADVLSDADLRHKATEESPSHKSRYSPLPVRVSVEDEDGVVTVLHDEDVLYSVRRDDSVEDEILPATNDVDISPVRLENTEQMTSSDNKNAVDAPDQSKEDPQAVAEMNKIDAMERLRVEELELKD